MACLLGGSSSGLLFPLMATPFVEYTEGGLRWLVVLCMGLGLILGGACTIAVRFTLARRISALATERQVHVAKLDRVMTLLGEDGKHLQAATEKLGSATAAQNQIITRQAAALQETQVTAQEIKQTSLLAAQKADGILQLVERANTVSGSGRESIDRTLQGMAEIRTQVEEIAQRIGSLSERTRRIGDITRTVKSLADQSNMLALNAAIEAVRSGEHGRGFAVVAREIRNLADQSIKSTLQVGEILEDVGAAIQVAVAITAKGTRRIEEDVQQARSSGEVLRELAEIVKENSDVARQISAAVTQQNLGIEQIFLAVSDQTRMMDETVKSLNATTEAANLIQDVAGSISKLLGK